MANHYIHPDLNLEALRVDVRQKYDRLMKAMDTLCTAVNADYSRAAQVDRTSGRQARALAAAAYRQFYSVDFEGKNNTSTTIGAVGASDHVLTLASEVNECKAAFKTAMQPLSKKQIMYPDPNEPTTSISTPLARVVLREIGLSGLKQRQVTREIPILTTPPRHLSFVRTYRSPSVEKISWLQARQRLERLGDDFVIAEQLAKLDTIDDQWLAVVQPVAEHIRVNVHIGDRRPFQRKWRLPVLYSATPDDGEISVRWPVAPDPNALSRGKVKIEKSIFLPIIHVHRYLTAEYRYGNE